VQVSSGSITFTDVYHDTEETMNVLATAVSILDTTHTSEEDFTAGDVGTPATTAVSGESVVLVRANQGIADVPPAFVDPPVDSPTDPIETYPSGWTISANTALAPGDYVVTGTFQIDAGVTVSLASAGTLKIFADEANIQGTLSVNSRGYVGNYSSPGEGPGGGWGQTVSGYPGGGGYGGRGGRANGVYGETYGSITQPDDLGSGGGGATYQGGNGGGAVKFIVAGTLTVGGSITSNGTTVGGVCHHRAGAGGSGGSIWLDVGTLTGAGDITANGGNANVYCDGSSVGGAGGGGRIAVYFDSQTGFTGSITAYGGGATYYGGAGTVFTKDNALDYGDLLFDNGGHSGYGTRLEESAASMNVTIDNGAILTCDALETFSITAINLTVESDASLTVS